MITMKKQFLFFFIATLSFSGFCFAQKPDVIIVDEVTRIETKLASDEFAGRATGTTGIQKAADFIAAEFQKAGLKPLSGNSFLQEFVMLRPTLKELKYKAEGVDVDARNIVVLTSQPELKVDENAGYETRQVKAGERLMAKALQYFQEKKNIIVLVDTSLAKNFPALNRLKRQQFKSPFNVVFLLGNTLPKEFKIKADHSFEETRMANVVGVLPGKSKAAEQVIFSAHYDHLGIGRPVAGDSIYNGANDDAAGTTAVLMLAKHFKQRANNERTLLFVAFTAEEIGGYGSQYFSQQLAPEKVAAMFNIEMIGTKSKWGSNTAFVTGYEKTNMGAIMQKALKGSAFTFYPDPYPEQQLFYRSDNATLARLGVPAHTLSTAKMDEEPNYHKPSDEVGSLDLQNMTAIIKAIAESSRTIVSGKETPTRVNPENLQ